MAKPPRRQNKAEPRKEDPSIPVTRRGDPAHCEGCPVEVCYVVEDRELCREVGEGLGSTGIGQVGPLRGAGCSVRRRS